jgi:hypothetical protein
MSERTASGVPAPCIANAVARAPNEVDNRATKPSVSVVRRRKPRRLSANIIFECIAFAAVCSNFQPLPNFRIEILC